MKNQSFAIVISTAACSQEAEKIALALIQQKLAACVQVLPIKSYFTWQNKLNIENENLLLIKCKCSDYEEIEKCVKANHSYEVPEILQVPIENGLGDYLNWIEQVTR